jgi:hypothetical protein
MTDPEDRIWNLVKELNDRENKKRAKEAFWEDVRTALFGLFVVLVFLLALSQGFNICMKPSGDCSRDPDSLLFKPREN